MISGTYNTPTRERFRERAAKQDARKRMGIVNEHDPSHGLKPLAADPFLAVGALVYDANTDTLRKVPA